jgi:hypothetical protein
MVTVPLGAVTDSVPTPTDSIEHTRDELVGAPCRWPLAQPGGSRSARAWGKKR